MSLLALDNGLALKIAPCPVTGCWLWSSWQAGGYGRIKVRGKSYQAHRYIYELLIGPIPNGLQLDHLCRQTFCVNPEHMEPVTQRENCRRGIGPAAQCARRTHCPEGHPLEGENLVPSLLAKGTRLCLICKHKRDAEYRERVRARRGPYVHHNRAKTHCPSGHAYTIDNLIPSAWARNRRRCLACAIAQGKISA